MKGLVLIKLGGSLITDKNKPFTENSAVIKRLCREIHQARKETDVSLLIGHGGGSYPHGPASKFKTQLGVINDQSFRGIAEVQDAACRLNRIIIKEFLQIKENAVSINPSSCLISENGHIGKSFLEPIFKLLGFRMLPVLFGDVVLDEEKGCTILSTERILNYLAKNSAKYGYKSLKIIHCGGTNGVYDQEGETIPLLTHSTFAKFEKAIGGSASVDVTGGMLHKVKECLEIANLGIDSLIMGGKEPGNLKKAILGNDIKGTLVKA